MAESSRKRTNARTRARPDQELLRKLNYVTLCSLDLTFEEDALPDARTLSKIRLTPPALQKFRLGYSTFSDRTRLRKGVIKALSEMPDYGELTAHKSMTSGEIVAGLATYFQLIEACVRQDNRIASAGLYNAKIIRLGLWLDINTARRGTLTFTNVEIKANSGRLLKLLGAGALVATIFNQMSGGIDHLVATAERLQKNPKLVEYMQKQVSDGIDRAIARLDISLEGTTPRPTHNPVDPRVVISEAVENEIRKRIMRGKA